MERMVVERSEWHPEGRNQRVPNEVHAPLLRGNGLIELADGEPVAAVVHLDGEARKDAALLGNLIQRGIPWSDKGRAIRGSARTSGIRYPNQTFGTTAPQPMRRRYGCRYAGFHEQRPDLVRLLASVFVAGWDLFREVLPEKADETWRNTASVVHGDWLFADTPWTSGIINDTVALPYHKDSGNITHTWSAMVVLRRNTDGGVLHLPEYNVALECADVSMTFFNGQAAWHGVTPVQLRNGQAYRRSIVMYSKAGCRECGPAALEAARAAAVATSHDVPHDSVFRKSETT